MKDCGPDPVTVALLWITLVALEAGAWGIAGWAYGHALVRNGILVII